MVFPKTVIFLGDGMADEPVVELGGKTPLQYARTPAMDSIAREGCCGTLLTLPEGFATSSDVANMSVLGCDLATECRGRGPLEAVGRNIPLGRDDVAFRLNLVSVSDGILRDYSGGQVDPVTTRELIGALNERLGSDRVRFHVGVSYRNLLVLRGREYSERLRMDKPDDSHGRRMDEHHPRALEPGAEATAALLGRLMREAPAILEACEGNRRRAREGKPLVNGIWPWSGGRAGGFRTLREKFGISGAVITAVDVIAGLGRCLGLDAIRVPGSTGYIDTNYEGKADAAIEILRTCDFVYLHVEGMDEVSHERDVWKKIRAVEDFDTRVVGRVLAAFRPDELNAAVLPDHPVPLATGKHTREPVPVAVRKAGLPPDAVCGYDEVSCRAGRLGAMRNGDLMNLLFGR